MQATSDSPGGDPPLEELTAQQKEEYLRKGVDALFVLWAALDVMREAMVAGYETEDIIEDMFEGILEHHKTT